MTADLIIRTGDMLTFTVPPPYAIPLLAAPIPLVGSGSNLNAEKMVVCLEGDEQPDVLNAPTAYTNGSFTVPGMLTVEVKIFPFNKTAMTKNGSAILIKGKPFISKLAITVPAQMPPPASTPDPVASMVIITKFTTTTLLSNAG